ncbi:hypothetical protein CDIK_4463 [Cucumispora dikerogammari]|nr:hypothetical protein CDIK_4463 [Cucumispora dikerogammari]
MPNPTSSLKVPSFNVILILHETPIVKHAVSSIILVSMKSVSNEIISDVQPLKPNILLDILIIVHPSVYANFTPLTPVLYDISSGPKYLFNSLDMVWVCVSVNSFCF